MRVKVEGAVDFAQVNQILNDLFQRSPPGSRIHGLNIYLTILDARGNLLDLFDKEGNRIDMLTYSEYSTIAAQGKDDSRVIPFRKPETTPQPPVDPVDAPEPTAA